jgi:hypothetical protein
VDGSVPALQDLLLPLQCYDEENLGYLQHGFTSNALSKALYRGFIRNIQFSDKVIRGDWKTWLKDTKFTTYSCIEIVIRHLLVVVDVGPLACAQLIADAVVV